MERRTAFVVTGSAFILAGGVIILTLALRTIPEQAGVKAVQLPPHSPT